MKYFDWKIFAVSFLLILFMFSVTYVILVLYLKAMDTAGLIEVLYKNNAFHISGAFLVQGLALSFAIPYFNKKPKK